MNFPGEGDQGSRGTGEGPPKMEACRGWDLQKKRKGKKRKSKSKEFMI